jgi:hypothetical protein
LDVLRTLPPLPPALLLPPLPPVWGGLRFEPAEFGAEPGESFLPLDPSPLPGADMTLSVSALLE